MTSLAKRLSVRLRTEWLWVRIPLHSLKLQISHLFQARSFLTFKKIERVDSLGNAYVTCQKHTVHQYLFILSITSVLSKKLKNKQLYDIFSKMSRHRDLKCDHRLRMYFQLS